MNLNDPILVATNINGRWEVQLDTWKGNLSPGQRIVTPQEAQTLLQENVSTLNSEIGFYTPQHGANAKTVTLRQKEIDAMNKKIQNVGSMSGQYDTIKLTGEKYVIGPNGNLMTETSAKNYIAPDAKILPKAPVGELADASFTMTPPTKQLKRGDVGPEVKQLQDYLVANNYMTRVEVDTGYGTFGPKTEKAVTAMQKALGVDNSTGPGVYGPRTIAAVTASAPAGGGGTDGGGTGGGGATSNVDLDAILNNPNLSADQKAAIQAIFGAVQSNDVDTATRIQEAMKAASAFSDPYFRAQIRLATDALNRGISGKEGDLAFAESEKKAALEELKASTAASKDQLSFAHTQELQNLARKYETDIATTQDNLAATGFTSSSKRARAEQILGEQNTGLVESSNKQYGYQTGNLDRTLASNEVSTQASIANLQRLAAEGKLDLFRQAEQSVGTTNLPAVNGLTPVGDVGGTIPRQQATDAFSFASNFVF